MSPGRVAGNAHIGMTADRVAMIDWGRAAHVDVPDLDLALPYNAAGLDNDAYDNDAYDDNAYDIPAQASAASEAAVCWDPRTMASHSRSGRGE